MKSKLSIICLSILTISSVFLSGCVPANTPTTSTPVSSPITDLQNWKSGIDTWKSTLADPAIAKINTMQSGGNTAQIQAELDGAKSAIASLRSELNSTTERLTTAENDIKNIKETINSGGGSSNGGISTSGTTGNIAQFTPGIPPASIPTSASGGIVSQVAYVLGQNQIYASQTGSSNNIWYIQRLINQSTSIQYVRPIINLSMQTGYSYTNTPTVMGGINISLSSSQCNISGEHVVSENITTWPNSSNPIASLKDSTNVDRFSVAPGLGVPMNNVMIMPISGCTGGTGEYYISPGSYIDLTVVIKDINTQNPSLWNISPSYLPHP